MPDGGRQREPTKINHEGVGSAAQRGSQPRPDAREIRDRRWRPHGIYKAWHIRHHKCWEEVPTIKNKQLATCKMKKSSAQVQYLNLLQLENLTHFHISDQQTKNTYHIKYSARHCMKESVDARWRGRGLKWFMIEHLLIRRPITDDK